MVGFVVSHLQIPDLLLSHERTPGRPSNQASPLDIMLQGPIGAASFSNEFGRPTLTGFFRTFCMRIDEGVWRGYHKPLMIAGGIGNIREGDIHKEKLPVGAQLIMLGGPAMKIGLGGGAASSMSAGESAAELDFASVQRANPEMQRRCQEVIDTCWALGDDNPIIAVHDVGAGGLANAFPELVHDSERGGKFQLRAIPSSEKKYVTLGFMVQ